MNSSAERRHRQTTALTSQIDNPTQTLEPSVTPETQQSELRGTPLDASVRNDLEPKFAHSFANVRVFADQEADARAQEMNARAFTVGQNIFFRHGEYAPASEAGREVLTHELAHTVQQGDAFVHGGATLEFASQGSEREAQHATSSVLSGHTAHLSTSSIAAIAPLKPSENASAVSEADKKRMQAVEKRMVGISSAAAARGTGLGAVSDQAIGNLRSASGHLRKSSDHYKEGHKIFSDVLKRADKEYEFDKSVEESVQGIVIAAALAVLAPEAIVATGVVKGLTAMAESTSSRLVTLGLKGLVARGGAAATAAEGAVGEVAEQVTGGGANSAKSGDGGRPSDSAGGAGATPGDRYEEAFKYLDQMIGFIPQVGATSSAQHNVAHGADKLAMAAVKAAAGQPAEWSVDEIDQKAKSLEIIAKESQGATERADALANQILSVKNQVLAIKIETPTQIEDRLWNAWMAGLSGDAHNILNNDVLEKYLGPEGKKLFDFGFYTSDGDTQSAVVDGQKRWLEDNGIKPGTYITSQYKGHQHMMKLKNSLVGQHGLITGRQKVSIGGHTYTYPDNAGELEIGTGVIALMVNFKQHLNMGDLNIAEWQDDNFDVYCNKLSDMPQAVQPD